MAGWARSHGSRAHRQRPLRDVPGARRHLMLEQLGGAGVEAFAGEPVGEPHRQRVAFAARWREVAMLPEQARRLRQRLLHHGRGVHEHLDLRPEAAGDEGAQVL